MLLRLVLGIYPCKDKYKSFQFLDWLNELNKAAEIDRKQMVYMKQRSFEYKALNDYPMKQSAPYLVNPSLHTSIVLHFLLDCLSKLK